LVVTHDATPIWSTRAKCSRLIAITTNTRVACRALSPGQRRDIYQGAINREALALDPMQRIYASCVLIRYGGFAARQIFFISIAWLSTPSVIMVYIQFFF
jgi:hypothetical protein